MESPDAGLEVVVANIPHKKFVVQRLGLESDASFKEARPYGIDQMCAKIGANIDKLLRKEIVSLDKKVCHFVDGVFFKSSAG